MIFLRLPFPPSVNTLYPSTNGRRFLSKRGKLYVQQVAVCVGRQRAPTGRIAYRMVLCPPDKRRRDLSNFVKAAEDCLTKCGFWGDDSLVDDMRVLRGYVAAGAGRLLMHVWSLDSECTPPMETEATVKDQRTVLELGDKPFKENA